MTNASPNSDSMGRNNHESNLTVSSCTSTAETSRLNQTSNILSKWHQLFAAFAATTSAAGLGSIYAYTATALPDMRHRKSFGEITPTQETWIGSLALLGGVLACPVAGYLLDFVGRRRTLLWMMLPFISGWVLIAVSPNMLAVNAGRLITGFCGGTVTLTIPVFLAEVSDVEIRGALTAGLDMMTTVGIVYINVIGTYASWQIQALACGGIPLLCFSLMLFVPESPKFLFQKGEIEAAGKALSWFRNLKEEELKEELAELGAKGDEIQEMRGSCKDFFQIPVLKPIFIGLVLMFLQQCSGILPITAYTVDIFHSAGTDINDNLSTIIVGGIQVVATTTSAIVVDKCGRRFLLLISQSFMAISMGGMGSFFFMKNHNDPQNPYPMEYVSWLPLTSLLIFVVAFSIGIGPISWVYMGEILPTNYKGKGSSIITETSWILSFFMTLGFGTLMAAVGEHGGYWIFGCVSLFGVFYIYFCVPETKGKTLDEIQSYFK